MKISLLTFLIFIWTRAVAGSSEAEKAILDRILASDKYDPDVQPFNNTGGPITVSVNLFVLNIDRLSDEKEEMEIQIYFRQQWQDGRLRFDSSNGKFPYITTSDPSLFWTPDIFFVNEKKGRFHDITKPNEFIRIFPDGTVLYSKRLTLVLSCPMNFKRYPFDAQKCAMDAESYSRNAKDFIIKWKEPAPVAMSENVNPTPFILKKFETKATVSKLTSGDFSKAILNFYFERDHTFYSLNVFIPCAMMLMVSWVAFWLDSKALTGRILLGIVPLFSCAFLISLQNFASKVPYVRCLDIYTGVCLTLMFFSLLETATVHFLCDRRHEQDKDSNNIVNGDVGKGGNSMANTIFMKKLISISDSIDGVSRLLFPIAFAVFCVIYFSVAM